MSRVMVVSGYEKLRIGHIIRVLVTKMTDMRGE